MREENEIMDELQRLEGSVPFSRLQNLVEGFADKKSKSELRSFHPDAHWFCPKRNDDDHIDYDHPYEPEEDMSPETKVELIQEGKRRHDVAYLFTIVFGLSPDVSGAHLTGYTPRMNQLLTSCDKCVYNWHIGRKPFLKDLTEYAVYLLSSRLAADLSIGNLMTIRLQSFLNDLIL
jgi:senataxin